MGLDLGLVRRRRKGGKTNSALFAGRARLSESG